MKKQMSRLVLSAAIAVLFLAAVVVRPLASTAQTESNGQDGTSTARAADLEDSFKDMESLDTDSV